MTRDLLFKTFEFRDGVNVTVRNGDKWLAPPGTRLRILETGVDTVPKHGVVLLSVQVAFEDIPQVWLDREHAAEARTPEGLRAAMDRAYGQDQWGPNVVVLFFELCDQAVEDQATPK